jgi:hypothetical protein
MRSFWEAMMIQRVWEKGAEVPWKDPSEWRRDSYGNLIYRWDYGNRNSNHGWEKDHIDPWGPDELSNYQPLQWQENVKKGQRRSFFNPPPFQGWASASDPYSPEKPSPRVVNYLTWSKQRDNETLGELLRKFLADEYTKQ